MATPVALRFVEAQARNYRRVWRASAFSNFLNPVLYLTAMGIGLGTLVDEGTANGFGQGGYLEWLAPGMLAATGFLAGAGEGAFPVMAGTRWMKTWHSVLNTPVSPGDIVTGLLAWITLRLLMITGIYGVVILLFRVGTPAGVALAVLPATLVGVAVAAPMAAFAAHLEDDTGLATMFRFGVVPLFLFSGTFFPISQFPDYVRPLAYATPLWHGVELTRAAAIGLPTTFPWWVNVGYLLVWVAVGWRLADRQVEKRLIA